MNNGNSNLFGVPPEMRSFAEANVEQTRKAFENFLATAQSAARAMDSQGSAARAGAREIGTRAIDYAEKNVAASLEYAQNLLKAKDVTEIMRLHTDYVQNQMRALAEQASEMGKAMTQAAMDAAQRK